MCLRRKNICFCALTGEFSSQDSDRWHSLQEYQYLEVDPDKWLTLHEKAQQTHTTKILTESLESVQ